MPWCLMLLCCYLYTRTGEVIGISFIDSTSIEVCHPKRAHSHKVFRGQVHWGKDSVGPSPGEARPDWEAIRDLAVKMGANWNYQNPGEVESMGGFRPQLKRSIHGVLPLVPCSSPSITQRPTPTVLLVLTSILNLSVLSIKQSLSALLQRNAIGSLSRT